MASTTADRKKQATKDDDMDAKAMANDGDTTTNRECIEIASGRGVSDDGTDGNHATSVRSSFAKKSQAGSHPVMAAMAANATAMNSRLDRFAPETPPSLPGAYATPPTHYQEDSFLSLSPGPPDFELEANAGDTATNKECIEIASGEVSDETADAAKHTTSVRSSFAKKSPAGSHPVMAAMAENATAVNNRPDKVATETPPSLPGAYATPPTHYRPPRAREDSFLSSSLVAGIQELPSTPQQFRRPSSPGAYLDVPGLTLQRTPELNYEVMSQCSDNQSLPSAPHHEVDISSCADVTATELVEASVVSDNDDVSSQDLPAASLFDIEAAQRRQQKRETKSRFYYIMSLVLGCLVVTTIIAGSILGMTQLQSKDATNVSTTTAPTVLASTVPSGAPTSSLDELLLDLPHHTLTQLASIETPQWKAFDWLSRHRNITQLPEWRKKQLFALGTFYYAFEGEHWHTLIKDNWMDDTTNECLWFSSGFGSIFNGDFYHHPPDSMWKVDPCNERGEFESLYLDLDIYGLNPSMPPEISLLTSLSRLSLFMCNIQGSLSSVLPSELFEMTKLTWLSFNLKPDLTDNLPSELGLLTGLETIHVVQTALTGSIPSELGLLTAMTSLRIFENELSGSIPTEMFAGMSNLEDLHMHYLLLTGAIPSEVGSMTAMRELLLYGNEFSSSIPSTLGLMTSLETLDLRGNFLRGTIPSVLGSLSHVTHLQLGYNELSGSIPKALGDLTSATSLHLEGNALTGTIPGELWSLPGLELLRISENALTGTLSSEIGLGSSLSSLWVSNNLLEGSMPTQLEMLESLEELYLQNNRLTGKILDQLNITNFDMRLDGNHFRGLVPENLCSFLECDCVSFDVSTCSGLEEMPAWPGRLPVGNYSFSSLMLNVHTDAYPGETKWVWKKWSTETAGWEAQQESGQQLEKRMFLYSQALPLDNEESHQLVLFDQGGDGLTFGGWFTLVAANQSVVLSVPRSQAFSTITINIEVDAGGALDINVEETKCSDLLLELGGATACPCVPNP